MFSCMQTETSVKNDRGTSDDGTQTCAICMDAINTPKKLHCGHVFCGGCIDKHLACKRNCPLCGTPVGVITGNQPIGDMSVRLNEKAVCFGYEDCEGRFEITYRFLGGKQGPEHPNPGRFYRDITRTAYLPNNAQGREVCEMLKVAFDRKLVFTIGTSRTSGDEDVITWNDIHHKTDPRFNAQFGYPDPTYLDRVTEELKSRGVTPDDIPTKQSDSQSA